MAHGDAAAEDSATLADSGDSGNSMARNGSRALCRGTISTLRSRARCSLMDQRSAPRSTRRWLQTVPAAALMTMAAGAASAEPAASASPAGDYDVEVRMEIPNVDTWSWKSTTRLCLPHAGAGNMPIPVLSPNNPFGDCRAANVERDGTRLAYDIVCEGRGAARAHAIYAVRPDGFSGRIAMVLGRRTWPCGRCRWAIAWAAAIWLPKASRK